MDIQEKRDALLRATLQHVAFDGWSARALRAGARDTGLHISMAERLFPGGAAALVEHFSDLADRRMLTLAAEHDLAGLRQRDRIALLVRLRLEPWADEREAVRRAFGLLALPPNAAAALRATSRTVDAIWHAAGDIATDFSWYTKRMMLAGVYSATALYWLDDQSEQQQDSWAFLARRLDDVMRIPRLTGRIRGAIERLPNPFRLADRLVRRPRLLAE